MSTDDRSDRSNTQPSTRRRRLGEILVCHGVLTDEQLALALARQKAREGVRLGRLTVDLGFATEIQITLAVADQLQIPAADMSAVDVPNDVLGRVERELAIKYACIPWFVEGHDCT